jgi:integrase
MKTPRYVQPVRPLTDKEISALDDDAIPVVSDLAKPAKPKGRRKAQTIQCLTEADIEALFSVIRSQRDRAIFRVIYHRGLRRSEVGLLDLGDYRPAEGRLYVHRKKRSLSAEYRLTHAEQLALRAWLRKRGEAPGPLFPSREHNPINGRTVAYLFKRYAAKAGIPEKLAHVHVLKHSCVTHMADLLDGDVLAVQDHVGHADIRSTMEYMNFRRRDQVAKRIEGWGRRGGKKAA